MEGKLEGMKSHNLILTGRNKLTVSGVSDVTSFDEAGVECVTSQGTLIIRGVGLRVDKLSLEGCELVVEGKIDSLAYEDTSQKGGLWSRLFG